MCLIWCLLTLLSFLFKNVAPSSKRYQLKNNASHAGAPNDCNRNDIWSCVPWLVIRGIVYPSTGDKHNNETLKEWKLPSYKITTRLLHQWCKDLSWNAACFWFACSWSQRYFFSLSPKCTSERLASNKPTDSGKYDICSYTNVFGPWRSWIWRMSRQMADRWW